MHVGSRLPCRQPLGTKSRKITLVFQCADCKCLWPWLQPQCWPGDRVCPALWITARKSEWTETPGTCKFQGGTECSNWGLRDHGSHPFWMKQDQKWLLLGARSHRQEVMKRSMPALDSQPRTVCPGSHWPLTVFPAGKQAGAGDQTQGLTSWACVPSTTKRHL